MDITLAGAFVASGHELNRIGMQVAAEPPLDRLLQVGDRFRLTFIESTVMKERSTMATVRWQGASAEHGCRGYGVEYQMPSSSPAA